MGIVAYSTHWRQSLSDLEFLIRANFIYTRRYPIQVFIQANEMKITDIIWLSMTAMTRSQHRVHSTDTCMPRKWMY